MRTFAGKSIRCEEEEGPETSVLDAVEMREHEPCSGRSEWLFFSGRLRASASKQKQVSSQLVRARPSLSRHVLLSERVNQSGDYQRTP